MKVKFLTPLATASDSIEQDEVRDLPDMQAKRLIACGIAEAVDPITADKRRSPARRNVAPAATAF